MGGNSRHVPQRTCVGCRQVRPRPELLRIAAVAAGEVRPDPGGRAPGRGAYLCFATGCGESARKRRSLERALKARIPEDAWEVILLSLAQPADAG
ncbi:MAG: YlxR family protein [Candidatus Dormibacteria bacterium]